MAADSLGLAKEKNKVVLLFSHLDGLYFYGTNERNSMGHLYTDYSSIFVATIVMGKAHSFGAHSDRLEAAQAVKSSKRRT